VHASGSIRRGQLSDRMRRAAYLFWQTWHYLGRPALLGKAGQTRVRPQRSSSHRDRAHQHLPAALRRRVVVSACLCLGEGAGHFRLSRNENAHLVDRWTIGVRKQRIRGDGVETIVNILEPGPSADGKLGLLWFEAGRRHADGDLGGAAGDGTGAVGTALPHAATLNVRTQTRAIRQGGTTPWPVDLSALCGPGTMNQNLSRTAN
jgi:hypothetical protein